MLAEYFLRNWQNAQEEIRNDIKVYEDYWQKYWQLGNKLETLIMETIENVEKGEKEASRELQQLFSIFQVQGMDMLATKQLLDYGHYLLAIAVLRIFAEMSLKISVLVCLNELGNWFNHKEIRVPLRSGNKSIEDITYGQLINVVRNRISTSESDSMLKTIFEALLEINESFRKEINTNKYIHRDPDSILFLARILRDFVDIKRAQDTHKLSEFNHNLLDLRLEALDLMCRCSLQHILSRFTDMCILVKAKNISLDNQVLDRYDMFFRDGMELENKYRENIESHRKAWLQRVRGL